MGKGGRKKGSGAGRVLLNHALRNAVSPTITMLGLQIGNILTGAAAIIANWERSKSLPGSSGYDRVPHEVMSCVFFAMVWKEAVDAGDVDTPLEVAAAILGIERSTLDRKIKLYELKR